MSDGDTLRVVRRFFGGRLAVGISPVSMCLPNSRINWFGCAGTEAWTAKGRRQACGALVFPPRTRRTIVSRPSDMGEAHAAHDVLDHVNVALAAVDVHLMFRLTPFSPCVLGHVDKLCIITCATGS